jgi:methylglutaconyl-CoA hydratase
MTYKFLLTRRDGPVEYLTLNRPDVRNAFNAEMITELSSWAGDVSRKQGDVRAVVIAGAGKVFCAGADASWLATIATQSQDENIRDATVTSQMFRALDELPMPVIGRVHGAAIGGGAGLAAVCDIVVCSDETLFGFTETKLGILPAVISPFAIAKIGRSAARELFLTGARFSAVRAREIGLAHKVVPLADLDAAVDAYLAELLTAGPEAIAAAKALIPTVWGRAVDEAAAITSAAIAARRVSKEGQEGLRAFLEKRRPSWSQLDGTTRDTKDTKSS